MAAFWVELQNLQAGPMKPYPCWPEIAWMVGMVHWHPSGGQTPMNTSTECYGLLFSTRITTEGSRLVFLSLGCQAGIFLDRLFNRLAR